MLAGGREGLWNQGLKLQDFGMVVMLEWGSLIIGKLNLLRFADYVGRLEWGCFDCKKRMLNLQN